MITQPFSGAADEALCGRLDAVLDAERTALLSGNEEDLSRAEREKASLIDALLGSRGPAPQSVRAAAPERLRALAAKNRLNGQLIAVRLGMVHRSLEFLDGFTGRTCVYGPDGVTHPHPRQTLSSRI